MNIKNLKMFAGTCAITSILVSGGVTLYSLNSINDSMTKYLTFLEEKNSKMPDETKVTYFNVTHDINLSSQHIDSEECFLNVLNMIKDNREMVRSISPKTETCVVIDNLDIKNYSEETRKEFNEFLIGLGKIDKFTAVGLKISNIEFLTNTSIIELHIGINNIDDITPLRTISSLEHLYMKNNKVSDLTPLKDLKNLKTIDANNNRITSLNGLENLDSLTYLYVEGNDIEDFQAIIPIIQKNKISLFLDNMTNDERKMLKEHSDKDDSIYVYIKDGRRKKL